MTLRRRQKLGFATLVVVLLSLAASLASSTGVVLAHAELISSSPANQAVLDRSPTELTLEFTEAVDPIEPGIRVVDGDGNEVEIGKVDQSGGSDMMRADISDALDDGTYVVAWQAISADSHRVRGAFTFSVGQSTGTAPGVLDGLFDTESSGGSDSLLIGVGRFLSYAGIAVLVGAFVMCGLLLPTRVGSRRVGVILWASMGVAIVGTLWMIAAQAHLISGAFWSWGTVADTRSGRWWFARVLAVALYGGLLIPLRSRLCPTSAGEASADGDGEGDGGRRSWGIAVPAVLAVGLLAVVAAGGHAITGDNIAAGLVATIVHLAAMAVWLGSLVLLAAAAPRGGFWETAIRVSPWALGSVVVLAVTGTANAWRQLGSIADLTGSAYGRWLVVKVVIVIAIVAVAIVSRRFVQTRPREDAPVVRRTVGVELIGMALVLMATAGLTNSAPPPEGAEVRSGSVIVDDRIVQIELDPAVTGGTEMHVYLTSPGGGLDRADEITVSAELPAADIGALDLDTVPAGPNHMIGSNVDLPVPGLWTFTVTARFGEFDQVVFPIQIEVSD